MDRIDFHKKLETANLKLEDFVELVNNYNFLMRQENKRKDFHKKLETANLKLEDFVELSKIYLKLKKEQSYNSALSVDFFKDRLEKTGLNINILGNVIGINGETIKKFWSSGKRRIPNYVEPILNLLIELRDKYEAEGGNFDFLKEDSLEKKKEEALKELEESKKILALVKENKALEAKILKLKNEIIKS